MYFGIAKIHFCDTGFYTKFTTINLALYLNKKTKKLDVPLNAARMWLYKQLPVLLLQYHKQTTVSAYMEQQGSGFHMKSAAPH